MIDAVNPPGVWSPFGAFSMAVVQGEGHPGIPDTVFVAAGRDGPDASNVFFK